MTTITLPDLTVSKTDPPSDLKMLRDVEYGFAGGHPLTMDILQPVQPVKINGPMPVLIGIHGGGWSGGTRDWCLETFLHFATRGYFCAGITHRFDGEAPWPSMIEDCKAAVRHIRANAEKYGIDPDRIGVWGFSSGGHLAALVGTAWHCEELEGNSGTPGVSSRVQAVCDWFGPTAWLPRDFVMRNPPPEFKTEESTANPIVHIRAGETPPFLIMHGDKDEGVTIASSRVLYEALVKNGVDATFVVAEGAGHDLTRYDIHSIMLEWFNRVLK